MYDPTENHSRPEQNKKNIRSHQDEVRKDIEQGREIRTDLKVAASCKVSHLAMHLRQDKPSASVSIYLSSSPETSEKLAHKVGRSDVAHVLHLSDGKRKDAAKRK